MIKHPKTPYRYFFFFFFYLLNKKNQALGQLAAVGWWLLLLLLLRNGTLSFPNPKVVSAHITFDPSILAKRRRRRKKAPLEQ